MRTVICLGWGTRRTMVSGEDWAWDWEWAGHGHYFGRSVVDYG